ncbi:brain and acute leukemia cytoplasmic protein isoform X2 [Silurus meridionalis]|uniref:brain and acute leukemia cytoplasmic protein isoform X2 n=1 Tax=Silurus meridionalis TaxID=175797 RepID=UPI001EEC4F56|nr:brain and acute leukemia cytoplasmic protein isoform X2 [Silurus meridionalis]
MGCGGSRTDALEPRYLESWTKETESTWLTSTDADIPLSSIHSIPSDTTSEVAFTSEKTNNSDIFDDGLPAPAQAYLKWQDNRMSTKQVTITVTQSIRQVDKSGKIKDKSHTTFEVMKPRDCVKDADADSVLK